MKKVTPLLCAVMLAAYSGKACDVCGCASSGQYFGLLPQASRSFAGVQYQYYKFTTAHPSLFENKREEQSTNFYSTAQAWGRYTLGKRLQLFGFVPYRYNLQESDTITYREHGIGDVTLMADVVFLNSGEAITHQLLAGGGVKLPTGQYTGVSENDRLGLPNMQPGTGSWDAILNANYTMRQGRKGLNVDASYTLTTPNRDHVKYGNKFAAGVVAFRSLHADDVTIIPQIGARYEFALHDYDNYSRKWLNEQSGGYMAFGTVALQANYRRAGLRMIYNLPVSQKYSSGYVYARQKIETSLFILIN
ncbi:MAG: hypothetical protein KF744_11690 [Taibaiella sp.]|nr:hypothetical protein [Taibaiella sp.]